jgi:hypothetical protein
MEPMTADMTQDELAAKLAASPSDDRVTPERIKDRIVEVKYQRLGPTLTHCAIHLNNGYIVTGESACVAPENYRQDIGEKIAFDVAFAKLWPLFGFLLAERRHLTQLELQQAAAAATA